MDTLNVVEIMPIEYSKRRKVVHTYSKIKVRDLAAKRLRDLYINLGFKKAPSVSHVGKALLITFFPKPPIPNF